MMSFSTQLIALFLSQMHLDPSEVMLWLRITARISGVLLAASFASLGLRQIWPSALTLYIGASRHRFTLLFALSHTLHLAAIVMLAILLPNQVFAKKNIPGLVLGAMGYVLIYYLAWRAFAARKKSDLPDKKMQTFGLYLLWLVFTLAFTSGVWKAGWVYAPFALVMWLALAVRIGARLATGGRERTSVAGV
jgi:sulfoxide reductase heme-binding subunit YedZ